MASHEFTSIRSPRIKGVRRLAKRTFRQRERRFLAEGPQAVREALAAGESSSAVTASSVVSELYATAEAMQRHIDLVDAARAAGVPTHRVSLDVMSELAQTVTP